MQRLLLRYFICFALLGTAGCKKQPDPRLLAEVEKLTKIAYEFKRNEQNQKALGQLEKILELLLKEDDSPMIKTQIASILDDQASIYLRTGHTPKARNLYEKGLSMITPNEKLASGIKFRLSIVEALEEKKITCEEPMTAPILDDSALPYFPFNNDTSVVFGRINSALQVCKTDQPAQVLVRMVVTRKGEIVFAQTIGNFKNKPVGDCAQKRIREMATEFKDVFPPFRACFKRYNYPFVIKPAHH